MLVWLPRYALLCMKVPFLHLFSPFAFGHVRPGAACRVQLFAPLYLLGLAIPEILPKVRNASQCCERHEGTFVTWHDPLSQPRLGPRLLHIHGVPQLLSLE